MIIFDTISNSFAAIFNAFEEMKYPAFINLFKTLFITIFGIIAIRYNRGLLFLLGIYLFTSVLALGFTYFIFVKKKFKPKFVINFRFGISLLKKSFPFTVQAAISGIYHRIDVVLLSSMKSDIYVGWYSAAYRLMEFFYVIPGLLISAAIPRLSILYGTSIDSLKSLHLKIIQFFIVISLPIVFGTVGLSDKFIFLLYGKEYEQSSICLKILFPVLIFTFINTALANTLNAIGRQKKVMFGALIHPILNIIANLFLIPLYFHAGASVSMLLSEICAFVVLLVMVKKYLYQIEFIKILIRPFIAVILMSIFICHFKHINFVFLISLSAVIYFLALILLKVFSKKDFMLIRDIFHGQTV